MYYPPYDQDVPIPAPPPSAHHVPLTKERPAEAGAWLGHSGGRQAAPERQRSGRAPAWGRGKGARRLPAAAAHLSAAAQGGFRSPKLNSHKCE